jgi:hypothetical protein
LDDLTFGPINDLLRCRNNDKSVLAAYVEAPVFPRGGVGASVLGARPVTSQHAADMMCAQALSNLCMQNVSVLEHMLPADSVTFGQHAVNHVIGSIESNSPLLLSPFSTPNVLMAVMSLSCGLHQHLTFPVPGAAKVEKTFSFLWAVSFGEVPGAVLTNKIIAEAFDMTLRFLDLISKHTDSGVSGGGWYSAASQGVLKLFNKFSSPNVLAWSPAFNVGIIQEFLAKFEKLFKKPVPTPRLQAVLEREYIQLVTTCFNMSLLSAKYREFVISYPREHEAWTQQCVSNQAVIEGLPPFSGISMIASSEAVENGSVDAPASKKAKKAKAPKAKVTPKVAPVPLPAATVVVPTPGPRLAGAGTRGTSSNLANTVCRYHAKHLYLDMSPCTVPNCTYHHQNNAKDFTKSEMLQWLKSKLSGDSDYQKLVVAIKSRAA